MNMLMMQLAAVVAEGALPKSLRHCQVGGDSVRNHLIKKFYDATSKDSNLKLHVTYGAHSLRQHLRFV